MNRDGKKNNLSNIERQCNKDGGFDALARPDLNVVHIPVSSEGGQSSIGDEAEECSQFNTGAGCPNTTEDSVCHISKPVDKEGKGDEGEERKDERFSWDA
jgi:hypothetical protein